MEPKKIELRSEKVRNIIGTIPPALIRYGISAIFLIIILLIIGSKYFTYHSYLKSEASLTQQANKVLITTQIPANSAENINPDKTVFIIFNNIEGMPDERVRCRIDSIDLHVSIVKNKAWKTIYINKNLPLHTETKEIITLDNETVKAKAEIPLKEISFFDKIFGFAGR